MCSSLWPACAKVLTGGFMKEIIFLFLGPGQLKDKIKDNLNVK